MGLLTMWREARGRVLRTEYEEAQIWLNDATQDILLDFWFSLRQSHRTFGPIFERMGRWNRKRALRHGRKMARRRWERGDRPGALGILVTMMHLESQHSPGDDAEYVSRATGYMIRSAVAAEKLDEAPA